MQRPIGGALACGGTPMGCWLAVLPLVLPAPGLARALAEARLAAVLCDWDQHLQAQQSVRYEYEVTREDRTFGSKETACGTAVGARPGILRVDHTQGGGAQRYVLLFNRDTVRVYEVHRQVYHQFKGLDRPPAGQAIWGLFVADPA